MWARALQCSCVLCTSLFLLQKNFRIRGQRDGMDKSGGVSPSRHGAGVGPCEGECRYLATIARSVEPSSPLQSQRNTPLRGFHVVRPGWLGEINPNLCFPGSGP